MCVLLRAGPMPTNPSLRHSTPITSSHLKPACYRHGSPTTLPLFSPSTFRTTHVYIALLRKPLPPPPHLPPYYSYLHRTLMIKNQKIPDPNPPDLTQLRRQLSPYIDGNGMQPDRRGRSSESTPMAAASSKNPHQVRAPRQS